MFEFFRSDWGNHSQISNQAFLPRCALAKWPVGLSCSQSFLPDHLHRPSSGSAVFLTFLPQCLKHHHQLKSGITPRFRSWRVGPLHRGGHAHGPAYQQGARVTPAAPLSGASTSHGSQQHQENQFLPKLDPSGYRFNYHCVL